MLISLGNAYTLNVYFRNTLKRFYCLSNKIDAPAYQFNHSDAQNPFLNSWCRYFISKNYFRRLCAKKLFPTVFRLFMRPYTLGGCKCFYAAFHLLPTSDVAYLWVLPFFSLKFIPYTFITGVALEISFPRTTLRVGRKVETKIMEPFRWPAHCC